MIAANRVPDGSRIVPRRVVFTDPNSGRFVSAKQAGELDQVLRSVYDGGLVEQQLLQFGTVAEDLTQGAEANWEQQDSQWGSRWYANEDSLSLSALQDQPFPEGFDSFRVTYQVPNNPDYPRPFANATWLGPDQWPPDLSLLEGQNPTGIAQIVFRNA